ncbi:hypothetical protein [Pleomorphochaeta sp. DL1XJH-081]|jgi:hypothetical protein|uniref:hypothetical protein n=1 Tax=Pleomorphochaeta sp. DL1XJH-081 TaxID=3409690 RepID=UPI003BB6B1B0
MKRILVTVMILSFSISVVSAGLISFGFGAHALNTNPIVDDTVEMGSWEDWKMGGEIRLGVLFLEAGINGQMIESDRMEGLVTVGTSLSLFDLLHLGVGAGPAFGIDNSGGEIGWLQIGANGNEQYTNDLGEVINGGLIHYRAHGDLKIGRISFGFTYQVPSKGYTLDNNDVLEIGPDWDEGRIGTSLLFWLF